MQLTVKTHPRAQMSALGQKRKSHAAVQESALPPEADIWLRRKKSGIVFASPYRNRMGCKIAETLLYCGP